eukprot:gene15095-20312_t
MKILLVIVSTACSFAQSKLVNNITTSSKLLTINQLSGEIQCPFFSTSNTASASKSYQSCCFQACGVASLSISNCNNCTGDSYISLYSGDTQVAANDDGTCVASACSSIVYDTALQNNDDYYSCSTYCLRQGCYGSSSCSGSFVITSTSLDLLTLTPTTLPTHTSSQIPTLNPSLAPTNKPTILSTITPTQSSPSIYVCPSYSAIRTNSAKVSYASCCFVSCGITNLTISNCGCTGNSFVRLYQDSNLLSLNNDGNNCATNSQCSRIVYSTNASVCKTYCIREGCYYDEYCSGEFSIFSSNGTLVAKPTTSKPSVARTTSPSSPTVGLSAGTKGTIVTSEVWFWPVVVGGTILFIMMIYAWTAQYYQHHKRVPMTDSLDGNMNVNSTRDPMWTDFGYSDDKGEIIVFDLEREIQQRSIENDLNSNSVIVHGSVDPMWSDAGYEIRDDEHITYDRNASLSNYTREDKIQLMLQNIKEKTGNDLEVKFV